MRLETRTCFPRTRLRTPRETTWLRPERRASSTKGADYEIEDIPALPEAQVFRGHGGLRELLTLNWEPWEAVVVEVERLIEVDSETVLLLSRNRWTVKESGVEIVQERASIFTVRSRKIVRAQFYANQSEALEAAGIES